MVGRRWWTVGHTHKIGYGEKQIERVTVMSNDTDLCTLLFYHLLYLKNKGFKILWQYFVAVTVEKKQNIIRHNIFQNIGESFT